MFVHAVVANEGREGAEDMQRAFHITNLEYGEGIDMVVDRGIYV